MTTIDTTLYCNGELRLAKHGAGKGGTVLMHVPSDSQLTVNEETVVAVVEMLDDYEARRPTHNSFTGEYVFNAIAEYHAGFMSAYSS